jgi:hypothetical protein
MAFSKKAKAFFKAKGITNRAIGLTIGMGEVNVSKNLKKDNPGSNFLNLIATHYPDLDLNEIMRTDEALNNLADEKEEYKLRTIVLVDEIEVKLKELKKILSPK